MLSWFALFELFTAALASAIWYLFPGAGPWPLLVGLAPWVWRLVCTGRPFGFAQGGLVRLTGFEVPLLLFLLTAAAAVWAAPDRAMAWAKFWLIVGGVLLFYGFVGIWDRGSGIGEEGTRDKVQGGEVGAWVLAGFGAVAGLWLRADEAGGLLALAAPFAAALVFHHMRGGDGRERRRDGSRAGWGLEAVAAILLFAGILFALLLTRDRGAWLAMASAGLLSALWLLLGRLITERKRQFWLMAGLLSSLALLVVIAAWLQPELALTALDRLPGGSDLARLDLYRDSLVLAGDYPFVGAGLESFTMLYSTYQLLIHVPFSAHAHNLLLDVAIEQGMVAAGLLVAMWGGMVAGWKLALGDEREEEVVSPWVGAGLLALVTVVVHGMVDDAFYGSRAVVLLFVPLAFAMPALRRAGRAWRLNLAFAVLALLVALLVAVLPGGRAAWWANQGTVAQGRSELAIYSWPEWRLQDEVRRALDMEPIIARYETALALDHANFSANRRLGQIALSLGEYEAALGTLQRAYAAAPWDHATRQLYGEALIVNGQVDEGAALWATVNNGQNQLGARLFWYEYIGDEERLAAVQRALPE